MNVFKCYFFFSLFLLSLIICISFSVIKTQLFSFAQLTQPVKTSFKKGRGYRDSKNFWCSDYKAPIAQGIPDKKVDITSVRYAADRVDDTVKFSDNALKMLVKVPF